MINSGHYCPICSTEGVLGLYKTQVFPYCQQCGKFIVYQEEVPAAPERKRKHRTGHAIKGSLYAVKGIKKMLRGGLCNGR